MIHVFLIFIFPFLLLLSIHFFELVNRFSIYVNIDLKSVILSRVFFFLTHI